MEEPTVVRKEATILGKSEDVLERLADFQERLNNRFIRGTKVDEKEERPQHPNVLDEILENLDRADAYLTGIMSFISNEVLPKIA